MSETFFLIYNTAMKLISNDASISLNNQDRLILIGSFLQPETISQFLQEFRTLLPWIAQERKIGNQRVQKIVKGYIEKCLVMRIPNRDLQSISSEIDRLHYAFMEQSISCHDLENPRELPASIEIQNQLDTYVVNIAGGDVGGVLGLFELLVVGLSGKHPQSEDIRKWFSTLWFQLGIDVDIPYSQMYSLVEKGGSNFPEVVASYFHTFSDRCNTLLISRGDTSQDQYNLFLEYSTRISTMLGALNISKGVYTIHGGEYSTSEIFSSSRGSGLTNNH